MTHQTRRVLLIVLASAFMHRCLALDLSPAHWDPSIRKSAEESEAQVFPPRAIVVHARSGLVVTVESPIAIQAGLDTLRHGGTAADAAVSIALTQVTTALGSYVSDAGELQLLYFDSGAKQVYSLAANWQAYSGETDPKSIPVSDQGPLAFAFGRPTAGAEGRKTLVPGFMAGLQALHERFGRLPWRPLFDPAIWYAQHGVRITPQLAYYFNTRNQVLARTPEGRAFLHQAGDPAPRVGDLFVQRNLAHTLRAVATHGAQYMYSGAWAKSYVKAIQRNGGKVTLADMRRYRPVWETPLSTRFYDATVVTAGLNYSSLQLIEALNLAEAMNLGSGEPYYQDPGAFKAIASVLRMASIDGYPQLLESKQQAGLSDEVQARLTKPYANVLAGLLAHPGALSWKQPVPAMPHDQHSEAIVIVDQWGNVAAITHTINTELWGDTGIVVDGIPIADAAGNQQAQLQRVRPGQQVPNSMAPVIVLRDGKPLLAMSSVGVSLVPETLRLLVLTLGHHLDPSTALASPPLLLDIRPLQPGENPLSRTELVPQGVYTPQFLTALHALGVETTPWPLGKVEGTRGTVVIGLRDSQSDWESPVVPGVFDQAAGF